MAHYRKQIRAALAGLFAGDVPSPFATVEAGRAHASNGERLPRLGISWTSEALGTGAGKGAAPVWRVTQWSLAISVSSLTAEEDCDDLAALAETRIGADPSLGGVVSYARVSAAAFQMSGETERRTALLTLNVETGVMTRTDDPENRA